MRGKRGVGPTRKAKASVADVTRMDAPAGASAADPRRRVERGVHVVVLVHDDEHVVHPMPRSRNGKAFISGLKKARCRSRTRRTPRWPCRRRRRRKAITATWTPRSPRPNARASAA